MIGISPQFKNQKVKNPISLSFFRIECMHIWQSQFDTVSVRLQNWPIQHLLVPKQNLMTDKFAKNVNNEELMFINSRRVIDFKS